MCVRKTLFVFEKLVASSTSHISECMQGHDPTSIEQTTLSYSTNYSSIIQTAIHVFSHVTHLLHPQSPCLYIEQ